MSIHKKPKVRVLNCSKILQKDELIEGILANSE